MSARIDRRKMPVRDANLRATDFEEVAQGYTPELAAAEATRCLNCKNRPCVEGCPVSVNIPDFIGRIKDGDFDGAYKIISETSTLPAVCGRVCPQENSASLSALSA